MNLSCRRINEFMKDSEAYFVRIEDLKLKRILCIVNLMEPGGAETFLMKVFRSLDKRLYCMDFITTISKTGYYDVEIKRLGGNVYNMPNLKKNPIKSMGMLYKIIVDNNYNAVMLSTASSVYAVLLFIARIAGVKTGLRSTNSQLPEESKLLKFLHKLFAFLPNCVADVKIAPSQLAADFMFGKNSCAKGVELLKNGIPLSIYRFQNIERCRVRRELKVKEKTLLIGHVGRFERQKNHEFIIKIFYEIKKIYDAKLMLVGQGSLEAEIRKLVVDMDLEDDVLFLGVRRDVPQLLMGMDGMIFPSLYEGLPNVIIESQATGLPCLLADTITSECKITDLVEFLSLYDDESRWANKIIEMIKINHARDLYNEKVQEAGYDIDKVKAKFINMFLDDDVS